MMLLRYEVIVRLGQNVVGPKARRRYDRYTGDRYSGV